MQLTSEVLKPPNDWVIDGNCDLIHFLGRRLAGDDLVDDITIDRSLRCNRDLAPPCFARRRACSNRSAFPCRLNFSGTNEIEATRTTPPGLEPSSCCWTRALEVIAIKMSDAGAVTREGNIVVGLPFSEGAMAYPGYLCLGECHALIWAAGDEARQHDRPEFSRELFAGDLV